MQASTARLSADEIQRAIYSGLFNNFQNQTRTENNKIQQQLKIQLSPLLNTVTIDKEVSKKSKKCKKN